MLIGVVWLARRGGGGDATGFFTLATPSACSTGRLEIDAANARFAAFLPGHQPEHPGEKFVAVDVTITNAGAASQTLDIARFTLSDRPGRTFAAIPADALSAKLSGPLAPSAEASGRIAFGLPASVGAAKLTYDDGCTRQEWLVP